MSPPFDEQAALEALEQLRGEIQDARARREQKVAEFDAFLRSSRAASQAERLAALDAPELEESHPAVQAAARTAERARITARPARSGAITGTDAPPASPLEPVHPSYTPGPRPDAFAEPLAAWRRLPPHMLAGAAILLVLVTMVALGRAWRSDSRQPPVPSQARPANSADTGAARTPPAGSSQAAPIATPTAPANPVQVELTTVRAVWMRVIVDGERRLERVVPPGQKLDFSAERAVVVRVGDAGAVRLSVNGSEEQVLGRAGYPITRTLTPDSRLPELP